MSSVLRTSAATLPTIVPAVSVRTFGAKHTVRGATRTRGASSFLQHQSRTTTAASPSKVVDRVPRRSSIFSAPIRYLHILRHRPQRRRYRSRLRPHRLRHRHHLLCNLLWEHRPPPRPHPPKNLHLFRRPRRSPFRRLHLQRRRPLRPLRCPRRHRSRCHLHQRRWPRPYRA